MGSAGFICSELFSAHSALSPKAYQGGARIDRVVREDDAPSGYRWGLERKTGLLALERERKEV
ncbi:MAG: hypothetical protein LZF86_130007 [Nitrospira sp.]|nr:MAG: hypothetical protein LZF86_130007 [Nitrospira sp.]